MTTTLSGVAISPVNMEDRKNLGIKAGDTVRVHQKIQDKGKTRIQVFEGLVLARKHGDEAGATFTVRKVASGVGVEKIFPLYSPNIDKIEIVKRAKVRRAKLYYIREKVAREIKRQMRRMHLTALATESEAEAAARAEAAAAKQAEEEAKAAEEAAKKAEEESATQSDDASSDSEADKQAAAEAENSEVAAPEESKEETSEEAEPTTEEEPADSEEPTEEKKD
ncbi:MAG: 50S ribosomal protein L19 [Candidatus Paceibacterota bacterium]